MKLKERLKLISRFGIVLEFVFFPIICLYMFMSDNLFSIVLFFIWLMIVKRIDKKNGFQVEIMPDKVKDMLSEIKIEIDTEEA